MCSSQTVDVEKYKEMCTSLYLHLIQAFPWISITPSLHKILAHSWEIIEMNEECGLKKLDESGLEGNNKLLRKIRTRLAHKVSQEANLIDCIRRMWTSSDPHVNSVRDETKPLCALCSLRGHSTRYCRIQNPSEGPETSDDALFKLLTTTTTD